MASESGSNTATILTAIGLILTTVGWFVAAYLQSKNQRKLLIDNLMNESRRDLTASMREFVDWCVEVVTLTHTLSVRTKVDALRRYIVEGQRELSDLTWDQRNLTCFKRLEEYETLFPATSRVRVEILDMVRALEGQASPLCDESNPASITDDALEAYRESVYNVLALVWDLLFYVQNESIGRITGHKIPKRQPGPDPIHAARLTLGADGMLKIDR